MLYHDRILSARRPKNYTHGTAGGHYRNAVMLRRRKGSIIGGMAPSAAADLRADSIQQHSRGVGGSLRASVPLCTPRGKAAVSRPVLSLPRHGSSSVQVRRSAGLQHGKCHSTAAGTGLSFGGYGAAYLSAATQGIFVSVSLLHSKADVGLTDPPEAYASVAKFDGLCRTCTL